MAICEISNGKIMIAVDSRGAELKSLRRISDDLEYMWSGDPVYWGRVSPILFPQIGTMKNDEYRFEGKVYPMPKHGLCRDIEFKLVSQEASEIWFAVESNEETFKNYPFSFKLEQGYRLEEDKVKVMWRVENTSEKTMYFSIGGHPAFRCPIHESGKRAEYFFQFSDLDQIVSTQVDGQGLAIHERKEYKLDQGRLSITPDLFDQDALIMEDWQLKNISILTPDQKPYVTVSFDLPVVAVWSPAGVEAPFICIEPWCGLCDYTDFSGTLEERKWGNKVEPGCQFTSGYDIEIYE